MASESMPSAWTRSSSSGIRLAPSRREYSLCVWRWTNAIRLAEDIGARVHCQNRAASNILRPMRPMRAIASLFALALMMALFHRVTAGAALEARATLALGFLLLAAFVGGDLARRARLPRITAYVLVGFAVGPWLGLVRRDEVDALRFLGDVALGVIALAAGSELALSSLRGQLLALVRLVGGAIVVPLLVVAAVLLTLSPLFPLTLHQSAGDAVSVALAAQLETVLVALAAGLYLASCSPVEGERVRHELKRGWPPLYILLFVLAGAGLRLGALAELWPWVLLLVGLRATGLRYGLRWAGRHPSVSPVLAREGWLGLVPQAGSALGLGQGGRRALPGWGGSPETLAGAVGGVRAAAWGFVLRGAPGPAAAGRSAAARWAGAPGLPPQRQFALTLRGAGGELGSRGGPPSRPQAVAPLARVPPLLGDRR